MNVIEIPAKPKEEKITRVAAYARVSADKDAAFHSLEAQTEYYEGYISNHPGWELVGIYSDNAISGTTVNRPEFQRMLSDCRAEKIDLIVTKSITRFARNTVDLLKTTRELKDLGIDCFFEKENMHSISPDGEFFLTLLAMYAEEEARSASENQKWRIKRKFEAGEPWVGKMLGYRMGDGKLEVVPEEAEIVRYIFAEFLAGKSMLQIAKDLNKSKTPASRSEYWCRSTILNILKNEKYVGNMILQKTYSQDFRTKKQIINRGEVRMYEVSNSHEAIISEEEFNRVQEILEKNRQKQIPANNQPNNLFAKLIRCGCCGAAYVRRARNKGKYKQYVWTCFRYDQYGKSVCPSKPIPEDILAEKAKELLEIDEINNESLRHYFIRILVPSHHKLIFQFKNGKEQEVEWQYKSRSESWTPEMRQRARGQTLARHRRDTD